jgi:hypothetical protein
LRYVPPPEYPRPLTSSFLGGSTGTAIFFRPRIVGLAVGYSPPMGFDNLWMGEAMGKVLCLTHKWGGLEPMIRHLSKKNPAAHSYELAERLSNFTMPFRKKI